MQKRKINYLNSPMVIIVPYCLMVIIFGINMILGDIHKNNVKYAEKNNGVIIQRSKLNENSVKVPQSAGKYIKKAELKKAVC